MKKIAWFLVSLLFLTFLQNPSGLAYWVWSPESGKFVNPEEEVQGTPQEIYDRAMASYQKKNFKEAVQQLRVLVKKYPSARIAPQAQYQLGNIYEEMGDYQRGFRAYRDLILKYPQSEQMAEALNREFRIGNLFLSGKRGKLMGLDILPSLPRAVEVFKHIVDTAPYSQYGEQAQFHLGLAYKKSNRFDEAIQAFQAVIDNYPQSSLIPQAHYQIADTSYLHSVVATRDQRVVDQATEEIDQFLKQYPDSTVSDKAAKLRQEIDEKNAEKNYRIALFYEKENFLDSAFIYYRDVSGRYPHTNWGHKAKERLQALERPAEFLKAQEAEVSSKKEAILKQIQAVGNSDEAKKKELEWELRRVEKEEKEVRKSKPETLKRRLAALRQKEKELKEKWNALKKKRKRYAKNPSDDLVRAFERWEASLEKEKADLLREKFLIKEWERSLGVKTRPLYAELIPFGKEGPAPLDRVQRAEAERLDELVRETQGLLKEKESLYREYEKLLSLEGFWRQGDVNYETKRDKLAGESREIEHLDQTLKEKETLYRQHFGVSPWQAAWQVPKNVVGRSVDLLNPFEGNPREDWKSKNAGELEALAREWREKVKGQKAVVDTIAQAFDDELARTEERSLVRQATEIQTDTTTLRRQIKQLEREIRSRYNEIQDRNERKNELLEALEDVIRQREQGEGIVRTGRAVTAPVRGVYHLGKAFIFGLPERDVELTGQADRLSQQGVDTEKILALREEIQLESILIEARNEELKRLEREVEALRAQVSLAGGPRSRSLLVKFPYVFIREAIASANRMVPKRDRREKLIEQLNKETQKLEQLKKDLAELETLLKEKQRGEAPLSPLSPPTPEAPPETAEEKPAPNQTLLREEIQSLDKQIKVKRETHEQDKELFEKTRWDKLSKSQGRVRSTKLKGVEESLIRLIEKERELRVEERTLLAKKKEIVEQLLDELPKDIFEKDLSLKKEEIESRLAEVQRREMILGEELRRFRLQTSPPAR